MTLSRYLIAAAFAAVLVVSSTATASAGKRDCCQKKDLSCCPTKWCCTAK